VNIKEYISTGIVESYVMGLMTGAEREEFEALCQQHHEIATARNAFETALEEQLLKDAPAPPAFLKRKIDDAIANINNNKVLETEEVREETPVRSIGIWKWVAAASLVLMAGSVYLAINTNNKYKDLQQANLTLEQEMAQSKEQLALYKADAEMLQKPGMKMVGMKGTSMSPHSYTTVLWDTTGATKDVYLLVNNLPQPASDKQYQLWALLDGKPIDLGMIENADVRQKPLLYRMKNVQNAQAFAITLEPTGGSKNAPTGDMYVMGQL